MSRARCAGMDTIVLFKDEELTRHLVHHVSQLPPRQEPEIEVISKHALKLRMCLKINSGDIFVHIFLHICDKCVRLNSQSTAT